MELASSPFVSVIIPVFNDGEHLKICLAALQQQTYPRSDYEVIVVDNGSDQAEQIEAVVAPFAQAIVIQELTPGSYAARNRGIAQARGEIIAFTDADCVPAADWIEQGVKNLRQTPNCGLVVGRIDMVFQNADRLTWVEQYEQVMGFQQQAHLERYRYGSTANVFTFRQVIDRVGLFDASLKSNGDFEWGRRIYAHGYQQVYAADTCIAHPARHSFAQLYKRTVRLAGGIYDAQIQKCDTAVQRHKFFVRSVLEDLASPVLTVAETVFNPDVKGVNQKILIYWINLFVRYVRAIEKVRLKLGGVSTRG